MAARSPCSGGLGNATWRNLGGKQEEAEEEQWGASNQSPIDACDSWEASRTKAGGGVYFFNFSIFLKSRCDIRPENYVTFGWGRASFLTLTRPQDG